MSKDIQKLVEKYEADRNMYLTDRYNETLVGISINFWKSSKRPIRNTTQVCLIRHFLSKWYAMLV